MKELRKKRRQQALLWLAAWVVLGAAAAIYFFDPLTDLVHMGRQAAFGPPEAGRPTLAAPARMELFFPSTETDLLARYPVEVEQGSDPVETARNVLAALLAGPQRPGFSPAAPPGTKLRTAIPGPDGTLYVDFDKTFRDAHPGGAWAEYLTAYAVANTVLVNFRETFRQVRILIEGQESETIAGALSLYEPLKLREDLVMKEAEAAAPLQPAVTPPAPPAQETPPPAAPPGESPAQAPVRP